MKISIRAALVLLLIIALSIIFWLLPISGKIAYIPDKAPQKNSWPTVTFRELNEDLTEIVVQDMTPWTYFRLELEHGSATATEYGTQNEAGLWEWKWVVEDAEQLGTLNFYHSCDNGCQPWITVQTGEITPTPVTEPLVPTKLGLVFADPQRDWHNRQGWDIEITYAQLAEEQFWGIDDLAKRVQQANQKGLLVLVRVEYDQGQSLPAPNDHIALDLYLRYLRRLARDARLTGVHGFIIGRNFNTSGSNSQTPENPVTPEWVARLFNGYGEDPNSHDNAVEVVKNENQHVRIIVGPVNPWNSDQSGDVPYQIDVPWLNYMNSMLYYLDMGARAKADQGIAGIAPDGFAVQAFGRVNAEELTLSQRAQEPLLDIHFEAWGAAQAGFRVYQDWLDIINSYEYASGKPVYINASNTFDSATGSLPVDNYPSGWLNNALKVIDQEPQIYVLGWFMDGFPHDEQWEMFSLNTPRGLLVDAAEDFDGLLQEPTPFE